MSTDLQQHNENELSDHLSVLLGKVAPYWRSILGLIVVAFTVAIGVNYVAASREQAQADRWQTYLTALGDRDVAKLETLASESSGTQAGVWARLTIAQANLAEACMLVHSDRVSAKKKFESAASDFQSVLNSTTEEILRQRAMWGLAQAQEGQPDLKEARKTYDAIVQEFPKSAIAKRADRRRQDLEKQDTVAFYKWFYDQEPPASKLPDSGEVPGLPFGNVPDQPDFQIPSIPPSSDAVPGTTSNDTNPLDAAGGLQDLFPGVVSETEANADDSDSNSETDDDAKPGEAQLIDDSLLDDATTDDPLAPGESPIDGSAESAADGVIQAPGTDSTESLDP